MYSSEDYEVAYWRKKFAYNTKFIGSIRCFINIYAGD